MKFAPKLLALAVLAGVSSTASAEITFDVIGGSEISFEGLFQAEYDYYDEDFRALSGRPLDGDGDDFELRRAELIVKGKGPGMWNWVVGYDAKADKFLDVNVAYRFGGFTTLMVGQYKQPNSLEELTSTRFNDFISKAMTTNMQGVARRTGVALSTGADHWTLTGSVFDRELTRNLAQGQGFGGRFTFAPMIDNGNILHFGLSAVTFDAKLSDATTGVTTDNIARIRVRPDADLAGPRLIDSGNLTSADDVTTWGVEGLWVHDRFKLQGEYMRTTVARTNGFQDFSGDSYYLYGLYNLTGETWSYKSGLPVTMLPEDPSAGMWQVGVRYDHADLNDGPITGGEESNWTVGVNWYLRSNFKLSANYVMVESEKRANLLAPLIENNPNIFEVRAQFYW
jgi:phosphate-selective porin OprO/OprP